LVLFNLPTNGILTSFDIRLVFVPASLFLLDCRVSISRTLSNEERYDLGIVSSRVKSARNAGLEDRYNAERLWVSPLTVIAIICA
jgi:hypothetical protein